MADTIPPTGTTGTASFTRRRTTKIVIDSALLIGFLAEFITREGPDYAIHSWIGIVLIPIIAVHLIGNLPWIQRVVDRGRQDREFGLAVLNAVLGTMATICIITGFPIWLEWSEASILVGGHTITGFGSIILMFAHLWKNRGRIKRLIAR